MLNLTKKIFKSLFQKNENAKISPELRKKLLNLQKRINYKFHNIHLLKAALTHDSLISSSEEDEGVDTNYERMEFLGDSVLGLVVCEHLFHLFPEHDEGELSKIKSSVVSEKYLALKANDIKLSEYVLMSEKEDRNGGRERKSIIADTMESLICAIYLDGGFKKAKKFIYVFVLKGFEKQVLSNELINFKSILQEYSQALYQQIPDYRMISANGPDHRKMFIMDVYINDTLCGSGRGLNKKEAQQKAARDACRKLKLD